MTQEDAINMSNEQAIQILKTFRDTMIDQYGCPISSAVFALDKAIEALSVQSKRKTCKWIEYDSDDDKYDVIKCPCCKHTFTVDAYHWTDIGFVKDDFKFCPNCGSKNGDARNE